MKSELLPCYSCNSTNIKLFGESAPEWWVECLDCNTASWTRSSRSSAIEDWNQMTLETKNASLCDCERSHNGLGLGSRTCDCPAGNPQRASNTLDDEAMRRLWRTAGGEFHDPRVETGTMPESKLLPFLRTLLAQQTSVPAHAWMPIETAPRDGTWIFAWRNDDYGLRKKMIIVRSPERDESKLGEEPMWVWPATTYNVWSEEDRQHADDHALNGDCFMDNSFTHWMPLPKQPG